MAKLKRRKGFTLLEAVLSLCILLCIAILLQLGFQTVRHHQFEDLTPTSDWFLFIEELESNRHSFAVVKVHPQRLDLIDTKNGNEYDLVSGKALYLRGKQGGYLPILLNYQPDTVVFKQVDARRVGIKAQTKDGGKHYAVAVFKDPGECNVNQYGTFNFNYRHDSDQLPKSAKTAERKSAY